MAKNSADLKKILAHWNNTETFSATQAAYLIMGIDPSDIDATSKRNAQHITDVMKRDYEIARSSLLESTINIKKLLAHERPDVPGLISQEMEDFILDCTAETPHIFIDLDAYLDEKTLSELVIGDIRVSSFLLERCASLQDGSFEPSLDSDFEFESQHFCRDRLQEWITKKDLQSLYNFSPSEVNKSPVLQESLSTKERNTLLKLIIGMAIHGYGFDPSASKSNIPKQISDDLGLSGISVDDDTVRKYLKQAMRDTPPTKQQKP